VYAVGGVIDSGVRTTGVGVPVGDGMMVAVGVGGGVSDGAGVSISVEVGVGDGTAVAVGACAVIVATSWTITVAWMAPVSTVGTGAATDPAQALSTSAIRTDAAKPFVIRF
jgi:hypothetical protein